ncbi:ATP-binding protein [Thiotrichales bacterium 19S9-12]|nr:ATP-binding protein [Thiotrichales bacterium 19S9-11]MCF6811126.1 ATP-binding protein [Thiotrichales bacterium 19S9-12]
MRIAVSGTHFMGKTTLIDDFIHKYPDYIFDEEPYYQLIEEEDVDTSVGLSFDQALAQLQFSIEQLDTREEENIIFDRCPVDFIAYAMCALKHDGIDIEETEISDLFEEIRESLATLDLIFFIPMTNEHQIEYTEENPEYREAIDYYFKQIYRDDQYHLFPNYNQPKIIEIYGSQVERMRKIESLI